jgi:hypothetical protein
MLCTRLEVLCRLRGRDPPSPMGLPEARRVPFARRCAYLYSVETRLMSNRQCAWEPRSSQFMKVQKTVVTRFVGRAGAGGGGGGGAPVPCVVSG